jgi:polyhydroxyalkanoate synthase
MKAIDGAGDHRGRQINALGFCVGGTILATALAVLAARGEKPVASLTLLTTLLDFSDTGVRTSSSTKPSVKHARDEIGPRGRQPAQGPGAGVRRFSFLRANDLVWNYVVGNYLKGETPPPFDLLYWNSDSTNLPGPMYCWYLRNTYLENNLCKPGAVTVCGEPSTCAGSTCRLPLRLARGPHRAVDSAYARTQCAAGQQAASCSARAATSPA